ncbi:MAG TPA: energy-coupling factor transporter ATPase [Candidatus Limnocylindria bacterium]|jgi:energy-coupling factor transport system ATP-binding protein
MTENIIEVTDLWHWYLRGTPLESVALQGASFRLAAGEMVGVMGHTGSGKSTLVQHFNGLLRPHRGSVRVFGTDLGDRRADPRPLRRRVGLVFQFPEQQLFDPTVGDDIAFGPRKLGLDHAEVRRRVQGAMAAVGLPFDAFKDRYTFGLSGGEMRKVAVAGVLALEPEVLVLDEPTAGLDPRARRDLLTVLRTLHDERGTALVFVSHNMDEVAELVTRVDVLADGKTVLSGSVREVFREADRLRDLGLGVPAATELAAALRERGVDLRGDVLTMDDAVEAMWTSSSSPAA